MNAAKYLLFSTIVWSMACSDGGGAPQDCTDPGRCPRDVSCTPNLTRCGPDRAVEQCKADGTGWAGVAHCGNSQSCSGGQCTPAACAGEVAQCTHDGLIQRCIASSGQYSDPQPCDTGKTCLGSGCVPVVCMPNQRFCIDGMTVAECDSIGGTSTAIQACSGTENCMSGSCVNACMAAEMLKSFAGCSFYAVDMNNYGLDDDLENDLVVGNPSTSTARVKVEFRQGPVWEVLCEANVPAGDSHVFALRNPPSCNFGEPPFIDHHAEDSVITAGNAFRITSDLPVVAYSYNSDDRSGAAASSGSEVLLPKATLGKKHYLVAWPQPREEDLSHLDRAPSDVARASMNIIGTEPGTRVLVRPTADMIGGSGIMPLMPGMDYTFMLDEGDVLQLETLLPGGDLSGTYVEALNHPIAVFAGTECALNPSGSNGIDNFCDHVEEQILPLTAWGREYVAPRVAGRSQNCGSGGIPELACSNSVWRIMGSVDDTRVTLTAPPGVTFMPPENPFMLNAGEVREIVAQGSSIDAPGDFHISSNQPIFVMQLAGGEPAMITAVPVQQYLPQYLFEVTDFFCTTITIVRKAGTAVFLDGMEVANSLFTPAGGGYEVARRSIDQNRCGVTAPGITTTHKITVSAGPEGGQATPAGISLVGVDTNCSYGYVGGLGIENINPVE